MKLYALLLTTLLIAACSPAPAAVVPTLLALPTAMPTDGPTPTLTLAPTQTDIPTTTPSPSPDPANCDVAAFWQEAEPLVIEFFDIAEVAAATSRMSVSPIILEMRRTQRAYEGLSFPECAEELQETVSNGMDYAAEGFTAFSSNGFPDFYFEEANSYFYAGYLLLRSYEITFPDTRLQFSSFIWGGEQPDEERATQVIEERATGIAEIQATLIEGFLKTEAANATRSAP